MQLPAVEILGLVAGFSTTCSFVPQVLRTYRTRSVKDISLRMYLLLCTGILLWIVYGLIIGSVAIVTANTVSLILTSSILVMKIVFGRGGGPREQDSCVDSTESED